MPLQSFPPEKRLPMTKAFRHFVVFQIKLFFDAFRDLIFSPISLVAFIVDAVIRPKAKNSWSLKVMHSGRRSDRVINLFGEYSDRGEYTLDHTVAEVETVLQQELKKEKQRRQQAKQDGEDRRFSGQLQ